MSWILRGQFGSLARAVAAVWFPSLLVLDEGRPELAVVIYLCETVLATALVWVRTEAGLWRARRLARREPGGGHARAVSQWLRIREAVIPIMIISLGMLPLLTMAMFAVVAHQDHWGPLLRVVTEQARWLAVTVLATAVLESLVAPVRSVAWLQSALAFQQARLLLLNPVLMLGFIIFRFGGSTIGIIATFVGLRLLLEVWALLPRSHVDARRRMFGSLAADVEPPGVQPQGNRRRAVSAVRRS